MEIEISGYKVLIDDEDFEKVSRYKWRINSYDVRKTGIIYIIHDVCKNGKSQRLYMHRLIMGCVKGDGKIVDHIDHNGLNLLKSNLRICSHKENMRNSKKQVNNTSGYKGVQYRKTAKKWSVHIRVNGKDIHIGYFLDKIEAARAYDEAALRYHGEFAYINFPMEEYTKEQENEQQTAK